MISDTSMVLLSPTKFLLEVRWPADTCQRHSYPISSSRNSGPPSASSFLKALGGGFPVPSKPVCICAVSASPFCSHWSSHLPTLPPGKPLRVGLPHTCPLSLPGQLQFLPSIPLPGSLVPGWQGTSQQGNPAAGWPSRSSVWAQPHKLSTISISNWYQPPVPHP